MEPEFTRFTQQQVSLFTRKRWYHTIELADGRAIPGLISVEALKERLASFPIPADLTGKRLLDVGAASGWCSFEMERRGAQVMAVDCMELEEFYTARRLLGSSVEYRILDVDELTPETVGRFDIVLFFGVLYHLRHPLLGLERICAVTKDTAFVESFAIDAPAAQENNGDGACILEFYETDELGGQIDNWHGPNLKCLLAMCRAAGFARVKLEYIADRRAGVICRRHWEAPSANPTAPAPWLNCALNNRSSDTYFHPAKDEYICLYFKTAEKGLTKEQLRVEIDGYGVPAIVLADLGADGWQANLRVPPGLDPGQHEVRLRTVSSPFSNRFDIVVTKDGPQPGSPRRDFPSVQEATAAAPVVFAAENNVDGARKFGGYRNEHLCCFFRTVETGLSKDDILVEVAGLEAPLVFLSDLGNGEWQMNSKLPADLEPGRHEVRVRTRRSPFSDPAEILFDPER